VPEKNSNARMWRVPIKLIAMLNALPKENEHVFRSSSTTSMKSTFTRTRKRLALKLQNPRLQQISFHTFRHWKATMEYYKTKDILHVMQLLGHKRIQNTLKYTQLAKFEETDGFVCKVAATKEEISALIEAGFEYICENNGLKFFRKPK
jgi:integrase